MTVVFGGLSPDGAYAPTTYGWDGSRWHLLASTGPAPREDALLAYDAQRQRVVLYGGRTVSPSRQVSVFTDTWEWDGTAWTKRSDAGPSPRVHAAMAYDPASRKTLLFGGFSHGGDVTLADTWAWDGSAWTQANAALPETHAPNAMTLDRASNTLTLMTVYSKPEDRGTGFQSSKLWRWNGTAWLPAGDGPRFSPQSPLASNQTGMLLYAGYDPGGLVTTWAASGNTWSQKAGATQPGRRRGTSMTYDVHRQKLVMIGGDDGSRILNDVWEWDGNAWVRPSP